MTGGTNHQNIIEILQMQRLAVLATTGTSGPRTALVAYVLAEDHKGIFFLTPRNTSKYINILSEPRVSLLVDDRCDHSQSEGITAIMVTGVCKECPSELRKANTGLLKAKMKNVPEGPEQALMLIEVERFDAVGTSKPLSSIVI